MKRQTQIGRSDTFDELPPDLINLLEQKTEKAFNKVKAGVGKNTILKFLGGNWKQTMVQRALAVLKDENLTGKPWSNLKILPMRRLSGRL